MALEDARARAKAAIPAGRMRQRLVQSHKEGSETVAASQ